MFNQAQEPGCHIALGQYFIAVFGIELVAWRNKRFASVEAKTITRRIHDVQNRLFRLGALEPSLNGPPEFISAYWSIIRLRFVLAIFD